MVLLCLNSKLTKGRMPGTECGGGEEAGAGVSRCAPAAQCPGGLSRAAPGSVEETRRNKKIKGRNRNGRKKHLCRDRRLRRVEERSLLFPPL